MTGPVDVLYRYRQPSTADEGRLALSTTESTTFLDAHVERADVVSAGLIVLGDLPGTRFYTPPNAALRQAWADPIVTTEAHALRFESLSACSGVAARLDVLPGGLDVADARHGTTNVDINAPLRRLLSQVRASDPMHLTVAEDGLGVTTLDGEVHERKVALPERWVRSLAELQVLLADLTQVADLDATAMRQFLRSLPRSTPPVSSFWLQPLHAGGLRLGASRTPGSISVGGPERLRVLDGAMRFATRLRVYGDLDSAEPSTSCWVVDLPHARLSLSLSPQSTRGFSGEGALLDQLVDADPQALEAAHGRLGYDVVDGRYFARELPFGRDLLRDHPRWTKAQRLVLDGAVSADGADHLVRSGGTQHLVRRDAAGNERCTCAWYAKHGTGRGPCAHVLAVRLAAR
ncbi:hypothetical protein [Cellulomonas sp. URHE0023]|uniref:hypothetical protein n=1 Tax=Cellulomonas sp. URHE0023 TaxID=1380354 RepID=UPI000485F9D4|nr:hypothetical protein [Cellulomonas sp. URHE0023]